MKSNIAQQSFAINFSTELPSGGLAWHLRAVYYKKYWGQLKSSVAAELADWKVSSSNLLLLGPSAGWTLPSAFLNRFAHIHAMDIDPMAKQLFCINHPTLKHKLIWQTADFMHELPLWLADQKNALTPLLFCNTLGQRGLHTDSIEQTLTDFSNLQQWLRHHNWFSYHDRLSLQLPARGKRRRIVETLHQRASQLEQTGPLATEDLLAALRLNHLQDARGLKLEITDHCTEQVLPKTSARRYMIWPMTPRSIHIIETGFSSVAPLDLLHLKSGLA